ncbi:hypothetical protein [Legionella sp. CNM-4043-24]|uniref:hypothetical protein n=1 Tax=Legionella sp. CNM-4043-24 TaxID=3421646 RepID=UPI00403AD2AB
MKESIISKPGFLPVSGGHTPSQFEFYETRGRRPHQQDALAWHILPDGALHNLTPEEIGFRLWTCYRQLDQAVVQIRLFSDHGTTASTTVYDGRGNLITATLADAVAFAAVFDRNGRPRGVVRLNQVTHSAADESERKRIAELGGTVVYYLGAQRVNYALAVSRAIGDRSHKPLISSDARIDFHSTDSIRQTIMSRDEALRAQDIGDIKIIVTCDGFTERAKAQTKQEHENYLLNKLTGYHIEQPNMDLSEYLAQAAIRDDSGDNISVSIQTLPAEGQEQFAVLQGVYDGHGGERAAHYVADNIGRLFSAQCELTPGQYATQRFSVMRYPGIFRQDHADYFRSSSAAASSTSAPGPDTDVPHLFSDYDNPGRLGPNEPLAARLLEAITIARNNYVAYHGLSRADKAVRMELNRGQSDGYLSFFRHTASGITIANRWVRQFNDIRLSDDTSVQRLCLLLSHPKTRFFRHSFGSFVMDALRPVLETEGIDVPVDVTREDIPDLIRNIEEECLSEEHEINQSLLR